MPRVAERYEAEQRDLAYHVWRECGQSMAKTLRTLNTEHEWPLARQTLFDWRTEYNWTARAAADDAEDARRQRAEKSDTLAVLGSLELHREHYERYFAAISASGEVDPKATQAYANLLRVILTVKAGLSAQVQRDAEQAGAHVAKPGGLTDEALAEIERKIGLG